MELGLVSVGWIIGGGFSMHVNKCEIGFFQKYTHEGLSKCSIPKLE